MSISSLQSKVEITGNKQIFKDEPDRWYTYLHWKNPHTGKIEVGQDSEEPGKYKELK